MYFFYTWEMCFKNVSSIVHADRNDRTPGLFGNFKCTVTEWKHRKLFAIVAGSFRENADGNAIFYIINCLKDRLQTFSHIVSVKEETVQILHPCGKKRNLFHFFFGNITGQTPAPAVSKENIKITAVVADKEYRFIRNIFFTDHGCRDTGHLKNHFKAPLNDAQRTDIFGSAIEFTNDPFHQKNRNGQDQVKN